MNCKVVRNEVDHGRELSAGAESHLDGCAGCRRFQQERRALLRLTADVRVISAPPDFDLRLRARLAATTRRTPAPRFAYLVPGQASIMVAAFFVLCVSVSIVLRHDGLPRHPANANPSLTPRLDPRPVPVYSAEAKPDSAAEASALSTTVTPDDGTGSIEAELDSLAARPPVISRSPLHVNRSADGPATEAPVLRAKDAGVLHIPVRREAETIRISSRDGATRLVPIKTVTFGAQNIIEVPPGAFASDSEGEAQGVW